MTADTKAEILARARQGQSLTGIAAQVGLSVSSVQQLLRREGAQRPIGRPRGPNWGRLPLPCDQRKDAKPRCWCRHCEANRDRANAAQQARIHQHRDRPRPVQDCRCQHCQDKRIAARERRYGVGRALTWRCDCGAKQVGPQCKVCERVPDWAIPEVA